MTLDEEIGLEAWNRIQQVRAQPVTDLSIIRRIHPTKALVSIHSVEMGRLVTWDDGTVTAIRYAA
jgi:hypothetical protein